MAEKVLTEGVAGVIFPLVIRGAAVGGGIVAAGILLGWRLCRLRWLGFRVIGLRIGGRSSEGGARKEAGESEVLDEVHFVWLGGDLTSRKYQG